MVNPSEWPKPSSKAVSAAFLLRSRASSMNDSSSNGDSVANSQTVCRSSSGTGDSFLSVDGAVSSARVSTSILSGVIRREKCVCEPAMTALAERPLSSVTITSINSIEGAFSSRYMFMWSLSIYSFPRATASGLTSLSTSRP